MSIYLFIILAQNNKFVNKEIIKIFLRLKYNIKNTKNILPKKRNNFQGINSVSFYLFINFRYNINISIMSGS